MYRTLKSVSNVLHVGRVSYTDGGDDCEVVRLLRQAIGVGENDTIHVTCTHNITIT